MDRKYPVEHNVAVVLVLVKAAQLVAPVEQATQTPFNGVDEYPVKQEVATVAELQVNAPDII